MATVSERSRKLAIALETHSCAEPVGKCEHWNGVIEQALLAERRLAWEAAIKVIHTKRELPGLNRVIAITALRAAAEKEVGK
jgi:hypothetical protein